MVDDVGGSGHGEFKRFFHGGAGGKGGSEVGGDGVAGADDVDFAAEGKRWRVRGLLARLRADDAVLRKRDDDSASVFRGELFDGGFCFLDGRDVATEGGGEFGAVHFEANRRPVVQAAAAVADHEEVGIRNGDFARGLQNALGDDAGFGEIDLIEENDRVG